MPLNIKLPEKPEFIAQPTETPDRRLIRSVTFFGDSAILEDDPIYKAVWDAALLLAKNGFAIVNGGGPGVMKAATDGAESINGKTIGIYWQPKLASFFEGRNLANVTDESATFSNYLIRTLGLIEHGDAYVVCKGGTGTVSELGMVWALSKLYYGCHKPVILYGEFWDELIKAFQKTLNIDDIEVSVLYQATTPEQILDIIKLHEAKIQHCREKKYSGDEQGFVLGKVSEMVSTAYDQHAPEYHSLHAGELVAKDQLDEFISLVHPPAAVLDVGMGPGHDAQYLAQKYSVTGIELSKKFAEIARFENPGINIVNADIVDYNLEKNKYKGIWARNCLHHIAKEDLDKVFQKLADALVDDGILYLIVREGSGEIVESDTRNYLRIEKFYHLFSEMELKERCEKVGLEVIKMDHSRRSHKWLSGIFRKTGKK